MITHQILLRGAAQCYLLQTAMHLTDVVSFFLPVDRKGPTLVQCKQMIKKLLDIT